MIIIKTYALISVIYIFLIVDIFGCLPTFMGNLFLLCF